MALLGAIRIAYRSNSSRSCAVNTGSYAIHSIAPECSGIRAVLLAEHAGRVCNCDSHECMTSSKPSWICALRELVGEPKPKQMIRRGTTAVEPRCGSSACSLLASCSPTWAARLDAQIDCASWSAPDAVRMLPALGQTVRIESAIWSANVVVRCGSSRPLADASWDPRYLANTSTAPTALSTTLRCVSSSFSALAMPRPPRLLGALAYANPLEAPVMLVLLLETLCSPAAAAAVARGRRLDRTY